MSQKALILTGLILREKRGVSALCPELDVASQGADVREAKAMLKEAVMGYLEACFESNLPYLRPVPKTEDPRLADKESIVALFQMNVDLLVRVHA